jgi:hypothetical protein
VLSSEFFAIFLFRLVLVSRTYLHSYVSCRLDSHGFVVCDYGRVRGEREEEKPNLPYPTHHPYLLRCMADLPVGGFAVNESVGWLEPGMLD